jgi:hypothetical protein
VTFDFPSFFTRHASSPYVEPARSAYQQGARASSSGPVPSSELLTIYQQRAAHLPSIGTEHALTLGREVEALCAALRRVPAESVFILSVDVADGRDFIFFESHAHELLGALGGAGGSENSFSPAWRTAPAFSGSAQRRRSAPTAGHERHQRGRA